MTSVKSDEMMVVDGVSDEQPPQQQKQLRCKCLPTESQESYTDLPIGHGKELGVASIFLLADKNTLAVCFGNGIVRLWDLEMRSCVREFSIADQMSRSKVYANSDFIKTQVTYSILPDNLTILSSEIYSSSVRVWGIRGIKGTGDWWESFKTASAPRQNTTV
jgi:WD40 repeat protein